MKKGFVFGLMVAALQGCATQFETRPAPGAGDTPHVSPIPLMRFQGASIKPAAEDALVVPADLRPGDIILTSTASLRSAGIQLMTFSPVSHAAVYIGNGQVVEAVGSGVRVRTLRTLLEEEAIAMALRDPDLTAQQGQDVRAVALEKVGRDFNYVGVAMHVPFAINRRLCELPFLPSVLRDACIRGVGSVHHLVTSRRTLFCSQLVLQSYRQAGVPITDADPRLISPADILHMRDGDVSSVRVNRPLRFVGHLKYQEVAAAPLQH
ncbi:MAG: YiiX/YebB-like N1pC/P60 family cysteine hydrolase [Betaproteobacteria bacterium]|nr:YiiX/YebB-like N1pC/P60 family cysteine hydrolase [Betaproteobacteria bacterium]